MSMDHGTVLTMSTGELARWVKKAPAGELAALMSGPGRDAVLTHLFHSMPEVFRADRARSVDAVVHWFVADRPDGGADRFEMVIRDGTCRISDAPAAEPDLTLRLGAVDYLRMVTGNAHAVVLTMKGKLRATGDRRLTARFPKLFDVPRV